MKIYDEFRRSVQDILYNVNILKSQAYAINNIMDFPQKEEKERSLIFSGPKSKMTLLCQN
jgi:hypothetical protein